MDSIGTCKQDVSVFRDHLEKRLSKMSADPDSAYSYIRSWNSPITEWSVMFQPERWQKPPARVHGQIFERIRKSVMFEDVPESDPDPTVIALPRGLRKTWTLQDFIVWLGTEGVMSGLYTPCRDDPDVMYMTGTDEQASDKLRPVLNQFRDNPGLVDYYGIGIKRGNLGTGNIDIELDNGFWIAGTGMQGRVRGDHPRILFPDDLQNPEDLDSSRVRESHARKWDSTIQGMMLPGSSTVMISNYTHPRCLIKQIVGQVQDRRKKFIRGVLYDRETSALVRTWRTEVESMASIWSARYSVDWLLAKWRAVGDRAFLTEWQNIAQADTGSPIIEDWILWFDSNDRLTYPDYWWRSLKIVIFIDLANSESDDADYTAIVTVGLDYTSEIPRMYVLDARRGRWQSCGPIIEQAKIPYMKYRVARPDVFYGKDNYTNWMESDYQHRATVDGDIIPLMASENNRYGKNKRARMVASADLYRDGVIMFDKAVKDNKLVVDELVLFPDDHDDYADAITGGVNTLKQFYWDKVEGPRLGEAMKRPRMVRHPYTGQLIPEDVYESLRMSA